MRYNSHTIKSTHLKYTVRRALVYSQWCANINRVYFQNIFISPEETPCPLAITHSSMPPSSQSLATTNLICVSMDLPILDVSYRRNPPICDLSCRPSLSSRSAVASNRLFSLPKSIPLYGSTTIYFSSPQPRLGVLLPTVPHIW